MLATIILDTFTRTEANEIAEALDMLCSPLDNYAFSSAAIYAFWSVPDREILYIGLAQDVAQRFRQHLGLVACDPTCCKINQLDDYFQTKKRIGYSVVVQSKLCSPMTENDKQVVIDAIEDDAAALVDVADVFEAKENITIAEGMLIEMFEQLADRLPKWNNIRGSKRGRTSMSLYSHFSRMRTIELLNAGITLDKIEVQLAEEGPPYDLVLNIEGSELSQLNARATLREIADNATICENELFLHGVRMLLISHGWTFEQAAAFQLNHNPFAEDRMEHLIDSGYLERKVTLPWPS